MVCALAVACDRRYRGEVEPVARSILMSHLEARNRALFLIVQGGGVGTREANALNVLRRKTERWTDLFIAYLLPAGDVIDLAIEPARAEDFADDLAQQRRDHNASAWSLTLESLRAAFEAGLCPSAPTAT